MKRYLLIPSIALFFLFLSTFSHGQISPTGSGKTLFVYGGQVTKAFIRHTAELTGKQNPKICFLPTATGDRATYINYFYDLCSDLPVEPNVQKVWISSYSQKETFEERLLKMDAIVVGGGNTLNMLALWKAQGIDVVLRKAYEKGIVLAGGSAGSLCWFEGGTTDSRPVELSIVEGLGLLPFSHCPHYHSEESRKPLYYDNILKGKLGDGYACDDLAGIVFVDGEVKYAVSMDQENHSYYVKEEKGKVVEERIETKLIE